MRETKHQTLRYMRGYLRHFFTLLLALTLLGNPALAVEEPISVPGNLKNDVLYYIVVDRFFDGETENNIPNFAFTDVP